MTQEIILCIPGTWTSHNDFLKQVITYEPTGRYMFAGMVLMDVQGKDHVPLDFCPADPDLPKAFEIAGQGRFTPEVLARIKAHTSVVYLHFPLDLIGQRERMLKFARIIRDLGGIAVKVESCGIAHTMDRWQELLSGNLFEAYCAGVVLVRDNKYFCSCGMHHFGLPECEVASTTPLEEAAQLMNQFNFWRIHDKPTVSPGETFSLAEAAPRYRLSLAPDTRSDKEHLFHNPHGVWRLTLG
ncbi:MAG: hypothetical protein JNM91_06900 [Flavobacteriales bacterium]|nr:hypothetical protein [Flavobacteriales bacterium]